MTLAFELFALLGGSGGSARPTRRGAGGSARSRTGVRLYMDMETFHAAALSPLVLLVPTAPLGAREPVPVQMLVLVWYCEC